MAPHAISDYADYSGFTPSTEAIDELKKTLRLQSAQFNAAALNCSPDITARPSGPDSSNSEHDAVLQLSFSDLSELEDAYSHFSGLSSSSPNSKRSLLYC